MVANFIILIVQLLVLAMVLFMIHWHIVALTSVPWVRTPRWKTKKILQFADLKADERVVDFGSGDGSVVIDAARDFGAVGVGLETQFALVWFARLRVRFLGLTERIRFIRGDMFRTKMPDADLIYCYLFPELNASLEPILKSHYPSGTRVVSRTFAFKTLPLIRSEKIGSETIFLYQIP